MSMIEMEVVDGQYRFDIIGQSRLNELAGDDFDFNIAGLLLYYWENTFHCKFEDFYIDGPDERLHKIKQKQFIGNLLLEANKLKKSLSEKMEKTRRQKWGELREKVELSSTPKGP